VVGERRLPTQERRDEVFSFENLIGPRSEPQPVPSGLLCSDPDGGEGVAVEPGGGVVGSC